MTNIEDLPTDAPIGTIVGHLRRSDRTIAWKRIEIECLRAGQPHPYADSVYEYLVSFIGGTPSSKHGWELAFATRPPFDPEFGRHVVYSTDMSKTPQQRDIEHYRLIKAIIKAAAHDWVWDKTAGESGHGLSMRLDRFEHVPERSNAFTNTYRAVIVAPFCG